MNAEGITYLDAIDKLEELRLIMKRVHKKSDVPYRKAGFQAMMLISEKNKVTMHTKLKDKRNYKFQAFENIKKNSSRFKKSSTYSETKLKLSLAADLSTVV